jgi:transposase
MYKDYPSNLSNAEWQLIEPLLPAPSIIGHPRAVELRAIVDAIFYVQREGCTWRALPGDFPPWQTVYSYLRLWQKFGIWHRVQWQADHQQRTDERNGGLGRLYPSGHAGAGNGCLWETPDEQCERYRVGQG